MVCSFQWTQTAAAVSGAKDMMADTSAAPASSGGMVTFCKQNNLLKHFVAALSFFKASHTAVPPPPRSVPAIRPLSQLQMVHPNPMPNVVPEPTMAQPWNFAQSRRMSVEEPRTGPSTANQRQIACLFMARRVMMDGEPLAALVADNGLHHDVIGRLLRHRRITSPFKVTSEALGAGGHGHRFCLRRLCEILRHAGPVVLLHSR